MHFFDVAQRGAHTCSQLLDLIAKGGLQLRTLAIGHELRLRLRGLRWSYTDDCSGILVPRDCLGFFPIPVGVVNPECEIAVQYEPTGSQQNVRFIYSNQATRNEYRITPVPTDLLAEASAGDYFCMENDGGDLFLCWIVKKGSTSHKVYGREIEDGAGVILDRRLS
jgi:hypothetical protein